MEQKGKGLMHMDNSVLIVGGQGEIRDLNGNGNKNKKITHKKSYAPIVPL